MELIKYHLRQILISYIFGHGGVILRVVFRSKKYNYQCRNM